MAISDYDATPANNSSISGTNIAEGCQPGNINDAIRQMMADIAGSEIYNVDGGTMDGVVIGGTTPAAADFTTMDTTGNATVGGTLGVTGLATLATASITGDCTLGTQVTDTITFNGRCAGNLEPSTDDTYDLGIAGREWRNLWVDGTANIDDLAAGTVAASGDVIIGTIDSNAMATATGVGWYMGSAGVTGAIVSGNSALRLRRDTSDGQVQAFFRSTTQVGNISVTASATAYNTSSDERLKTNIADAPNPGDILDGLQVRSFDWKATGDHETHGVIAQEVLAIYPKAVSEGDDGMLGVDYSKFVPLLIKEIQGLRARVAELEG